MNTRYDRLHFAVLLCTALTGVFLYRAAAAEGLPVGPVPTGSVAGIVTDASTGDPVESAHVYIGSIDLLCCIRETRTDSDGRYAFDNVPAGTYALAVFKPHYRIALAKVTVVSNETVIRDFELVPIETPQVGTISGTVTDALTGLPINRVLVFVKPDLSEVWDTADCNMYRLWAVTNQQGEYTINRVPEGTHCLVAAKRGYRISSQIVEVSAGESVTADFQLVRKVLPETGSLAGKVFDAETSEPIGNAIVLVRLERLDWLTNVRRFAVRTDPDGSYLIEGIPVGVHRAFAAKCGYHIAREEVEILANETAELDFFLEPIELTACGAIEGHVTDELTSDPLEGVHVIVPLLPVPYACCPVTTPHTVTDADGYYRLERVPAGLRRVVAFKRGYEISVCTTEVIAEQTTTVDIVLTPRVTGQATIRVIVRDAVTGLPVRDAVAFFVCNPWILPTCDWNPWRGASSNEGTTFIPDVPGGSQLLIVSKGGYESAVVNVSVPGFGAPAMGADGTTVEVWLEPIGQPPGVPALMPFGMVFAGGTLLGLGAVFLRKAIVSRRR